MWSLYRTPWDLERLFMPTHSAPQQSTASRQNPLDSSLHGLQLPHSQSLPNTNSLFFKQG